MKDLEKLARAENTTCAKCSGQMIPSKALEPTMSGIPDFANDTYASTVSPSGRARLVDCVKCAECGWGVSV